MTSYLCSSSEHPLLDVMACNIVPQSGTHLLDSSVQISVVLWTALKDEVPYRQVRRLEVDSLAEVRYVSVLDRGSGAERKDGRGASSPHITLPPQNSSVVSCEQQH